MIIGLFSLSIYLCILLLLLVCVTRVVSYSPPFLLICLLIGLSTSISIFTFSIFSLQCAFYRFLSFLLLIIIVTQNKVESEDEDDVDDEDEDRDALGNSLFLTPADFSLMELDIHSRVSTMYIVEVY